MRGLLRFTVALILAPVARADITITFEDQAPDVAMTLSGSLNITGMDTLAFEVIGYDPAVDSPATEFVVRPSDPYLLTYPAGTDCVWSLLRPSSLGDAQPYGDGGPHSIRYDEFSSLITGDVFGFRAKSVGVPCDYTSGAPLSASSVFPGQSLDSLGMIPGAYAWAVPSGDLIQVNVGSTAVPEPSALLLLAAVAAGFGLWGWRQR
jgi:hypothetical protein